MHAAVYSNAKRFLLDLVKNTPFKILSINGTPSQQTPI